VPKETTAVAHAGVRAEEGQVTEHERSQVGHDLYAPEGLAAIHPITWLWLLASGLAFWLGVVEAVVWLV